MTEFSQSLTYEPFHGLREKPFSLSADPRFLFKSPAHAPAFDALLGGIRRREGLIVLTGDTGTGKTTLCRSVLQELDRRTFAAFVPDPFVSREDLLKILLVDFGVITISDLKRGRLTRASRLELSYTLYEFLDSLVPLQAFAVLIIDEAQNLPLLLLEEIRILADLERREKLLQVVLVGQPELRASLKQPQMQQVAQRVSVRCELRALDPDGVAGYVNHRLAIASDGESRVEFIPASLDAVYHGSSGVPRLINRICDRALHRAYLSGTSTIDANIVWAAMDDLGLSSAPAVEQPPTTAPVGSSTRAPLRIFQVSDHFPVRELVSTGEVLQKPLAAPSPSEFPEEAETEPPVTRPASKDSSSAWYRWTGLGSVWLLVFALSLSGTAWGLRVLGSNGTLPPLPPTPVFGHDIAALPFPNDVETSALLAVETSPIIGASVSGRKNNYAIAVATFTSRRRAERLVQELTRAGYRARDVEVDLGPPRGRLLQVIVGGYSSAIEVERDLRRIRELPGYSDARVLDRQ